MYLAEHWYSREPWWKLSRSVSVAGKSKKWLPTKACCLSGCCKSSRRSHSVWASVEERSGKEDGFHSNSVFESWVLSWMMTQGHGHNSRAENTHRWYNTSKMCFGKDKDSPVIGKRIYSFVYFILYMFKMFNKNARVQNVQNVKNLNDYPGTPHPGTR